MTSKVVIGLCFVILAFALILGLLSGGGKKEQAQKAPVAAVDAYIHFDGERFAITNNNDYDWTNVRFEVNSGPGLPSGGYVLKHSPMEAGHIYSVEALQFCKADGDKAESADHQAPELLHLLRHPGRPGHRLLAWETKVKFRW